jgi:hypothetical protein
MMRLLLHWAASLLLAGMWISSVAFAQGTSQSESSYDRPPATIPYAFALVIAIVVLLIVCIPSRKQPP